MKKKIIIIFVLKILFISQIIAQNLLLINDLNGIWRNMTDTIQYVIFFNGKSVFVSYKQVNDIKEAPFYLGAENIASFISKSDTLWKYEKNEGMLGDDYLLWGVPYNFYFETNDEMGDLLELESTNVFTYRKVKQLPNLYIHELYKQGEKDKRNYLKEYLDKDFRKIGLLKSRISSAPNTSSKMYLLKGDEVEILQEKDDWLQIRYYGKKTIEGWIKKSDVE